MYLFLYNNVIKDYVIADLLNYYFIIHSIHILATLAKKAYLLTNEFVFNRHVH